MGKLYHFILTRSNVNTSVSANQPKKKKASDGVFIVFTTNGYESEKVSCGVQI